MTGGSRQIARIARMLGVPPSEVHGLDGVSEPDLRALHDRISATLFAAERDRYTRVAGLSKLLPVPITAKIAERFLPGPVAARVTEVLDPVRTRELVERLSLPYLGDITTALDPARARAGLLAIPAARIGEVAGELYRRGEYEVVAEFLGVVGVEAVAAAIGAAGPRDLLALAPLVGRSDDLDQVLRHLPAAQVRRITAELRPEELARLAALIGPEHLGPGRLETAG